MSDPIDRKEALKALEETKPTVWTESDYELGQKNQWSLDILVIECLPPAEPKKGKWKPFDVYEVVVACSECKQKFTYEHNYCPHCGAEMR